MISFTKKTYVGCLSIGLSDGVAANFATLAKNRFDKGIFKSPSKLINETIKDAKKYAVKKR